ncbi:MAG: CRISPR-associated endonuclease Cas2 [Candidatus Viridilinea halotolerans]|uniref:CRISPR-associated endoribonuclease Cas2 n=1 Tax=Candidatus Viridilinea halotolerans TaxID=2491704 RepID=A0A426TU79_9CHLR|nr:MAG: CRISPR-associated endonuclease Cas2 [Candidatus Viridilinea halotolerans]
MGRSETTQLYIVAYDIPEDKRRTKVHRLLCGYGTWTQYSLFECWLTKRQLIELRAKLSPHLREDRDSVRLYVMCGACQQNVITIGSAAPNDPVTVIL